MIQHLVDSYQTVAPFDLSKIAIDRGAVVNGATAPINICGIEIQIQVFHQDQYPGFGEGLVVSAGDEHEMRPDI